MMRHPFLLLGLTALFLASPRAASAEWIDDSANLFSPAAKDQARKAIDDFQHQFGMGFWIETVTQMPPDRLQAYERGVFGARDVVLRDWARDRANEKQVDGAYVLIWKDTANKGRFRVRVVTRPDSAARVFGDSERRKLQSLFEDNIERQHADDALRSAVRSIHEVALDASRPAFHWLWLVGVLAGLLIIWVVAALVRLRLRRGELDVLPGLVLPPVGAGMLGGMVGLMGRYPVSKEGLHVEDESPPTSQYPADATTLPYGPVEVVEDTRPSV